MYTPYDLLIEVASHFVYKDSVDIKCQGTSDKMPKHRQG